MELKKEKPTTLAACLPSLTPLARRPPFLESTARFAVVGFLALSIDLALFRLSLSRGITVATAHFLSFAFSIFFFVISWTLSALAQREKNESIPVTWHQPFSLAIVALLSAFLRGGVLATFTDLVGWAPQVAILPAMAVSSFTVYLGCTLFVFPSQEKAAADDLSWRVLVLGGIGYAVLLRLFYLGAANLLPQEAYYWNYAQHLDFGYLDHPPMVAWVIWLGTHLLGNGEMGVRLGAFLAWLVTAFFSFRLTRDLFDSSSALRALLLLAILPFFFGTGLVITPDALLVPCWAGLLYFLERSLLGGRRSAWWGVGVCAGLGMLSKYTISLLGPPLLLFLLIDREARRWFFRPEPYATLVLAFLLFLPVIIWNGEHQWVSFFFQGPRRFQESWHFNLPQLAGSVLVLLTPMGALAALSAFLYREGGRREETGVPFENRNRLFLLLFTLFPLAFFGAFSLGHSVKLNWTGPVWLALIPLMAWQMDSRAAVHPGRLLRFSQRAWGPTILGTLVLYGAILHFWALGLPGFTYPRVSDLDLLFGWQDLARKVAQIEEQTRVSTGVKPLVVGMDKCYITSELIYYQCHRADENTRKEVISHTVGRHIFGSDSLMYRYWLPEPEERRLIEEHPILILISHEPGELKDNRINFTGWTRDKVQELDLERDGVTVGRYYYTLARPN